VKSTYSAVLTTDSETYCRVSCPLSTYYYEAIEVRATRTGNYSITSYSSVDTYGSIYIYSFDPSHPDLNLLAQNDDGGNNRQFKLTVFLQPWITYTLIVTTFSTNVTGKVSIIASGPEYVGFTRRNTPQTSTTTQTSEFMFRRFFDALVPSYLPRLQCDPAIRPKIAHFFALMTI
jgi:hypothetical protein